MYFKEIWFADGFYICGTFTSEQIRRMQDDHGLIVDMMTYNTKW